jgi:hypothetical protein
LHPRADFGLKPTLHTESFYDIIKKQKTGIFLDTDHIALGAFEIDWRGLNQNGDSE